MIGAAQYSTNPDGAVMPTSPAIAPLPAMPTSSDRLLIQTASEAPITPAAAASCVLSITSPKKEAEVSKVEPPLNPNHPIQRMITPRPNIGTDGPGVPRGLPFASYLPLRAPSSSSAARAPVAPVR